MAIYLVTVSVKTVSINTEKDLVEAKQKSIYVDIPIRDKKVKTRFNTNK